MITPTKTAVAGPSFDLVMSALLGAYHNAAHSLLLSENEKAAHRDGVRDVAVRLGLYSELCSRLEPDRQEDA